jgi:hypothetical protein
LADKLSHLLIDALGRAALAPGGTSLIGTKAAPGLFPATAPARQAAQRARDEGLIRLVTGDPKGKPDRDLYAATDAGLAFLLRHTSPKQVLEDLARAVEGQHSRVEDLLSVARETQAELAAIKTVLAKLGEPKAATTKDDFDPRTPVADASGAPDWLVDLRQHLADWDAGNAAGDCPLPDLYRRLQSADAALTIGQFHDGLRELHDREQVYLHPWTGPLYALPEPAFALLVGHEIAYYASLRSGQWSMVRGRPEMAVAG